MSRPIQRLWVMAIAGVLVSAGLLVRTAAAQKATPRPQDKLAIAENEFKQFLLAMDTEGRGKISKEEFLKFAQAEFERLDKQKTGELDVKELAQSMFHTKGAVGK